MTDYLFRFSPDPYKGGFYELPSSFACVIPQSQHVSACSLSYLNTKTYVRILFTICSTETKILFLQPSQKERGNINPLKGCFFQTSFLQTDCLQELIFSFLSFHENTSFYKIFICFVFLSSHWHHNILLPNKVGKIPIVHLMVKFYFWSSKMWSTSSLRLFPE